MKKKVTYARATMGDDFDQIDQGQPAEVKPLNASDLKGGQQADGSYNFQIKQERKMTEEEKEIEIQNGKAIDAAMKNQFDHKMEVLPQDVVQ